jgi:hypothetical protein
VLKQPKGGPKAKIIYKKAECLWDMLFPKPPEADLADLGHLYLELIKFLAILA